MENPKPVKLTVSHYMTGIKKHGFSFIQTEMEYKGNKQVKLQVIGDVCNRQDIMQLSKKNANINLLGKIPREEVLKQMRKSDIFALPSSKETFGLEYLEAAATNNAIIAFKGEGVWGVFEENEEMLFCESYTDFKQFLCDIIDDEEKQNALQENAYNKALSMEWSKIIERYNNLYNNLL